MAEHKINPFEVALNFYTLQAWTQNKERFFELLTQYKIGTETPHLFQLGYAPKGNYLIEFLQGLKQTGLKQGYLEGALDAGIIIKSEKGYVELFQDQIIFPIINHADITVGLRVGCGEASDGLRISCTSALFGEHLLFEGECVESYIILTDDELCTIKLHEIGITCSLALLGVEIPQSCKAKLANSTKQVFLCMNNILIAQSVKQSLTAIGIDTYTVENSEYSDFLQFLENESKEGLFNKMKLAQACV